PTGSRPWEAKRPSDLPISPPRPKGVGEGTAGRRPGVGGNVILTGSVPHEVGEGTAGRRPGVGGNDRHLSRGGPNPGSRSASTSRIRNTVQKMFSQTSSFQKRRTVQPRRRKYLSRARS